MPGKDAPKLTKRTVDALVVGSKDAVFWDRDLPGFGVRVYTTGRKVYVVQTRGPGGPKRVTIARHGEVLRRGGEEAGGRHHRPHQARRGSGSPAACTASGPWPIWPSATCARMWR